MLHGRCPRDRQHLVKPPLFCDTSRTNNFDPLNRALLLIIIFFDDRAADGRNHSAKMRGSKFRNKIHLCNVNFSLQEGHFCKTVSQTACIFGRSNE